MILNTDCCRNLKLLCQMISANEIPDVLLVLTWADHTPFVLQCLERKLVGNTMMKPERFLQPVFRF